MEILRFVFSGFWVFVGSVVLAGVLLEGTAEIINALASLVGAWRSKSPRLSEQVRHRIAFEDAAKVGSADDISQAIRRGSSKSLTS